MILFGYSPDIELHLKSVPFPEMLYDKVKESCHEVNTSYDSVQLKVCDLVRTVAGERFVIVKLSEADNTPDKQSKPDKKIFIRERIYSTLSSYRNSERKSRKKIVNKQLDSHL